MNGSEPASRFSTTLAALALGFLAACSDAPRWTGTVETANGVDVVSNPAEPLSGGAVGPATELWTYQGPEWLDPTRVHAGPASIEVVDPQANRVHAVSPSGEPEASIGRTGGGPGEFLHLLDAFRLGDTLVVVDGGKGSAERLDPAGRYLSSQPLPGQPWGGLPLADGTVLFEGEFLSDPREQSYGDWVTIKGGAPRAFPLPPLEPLPEEQGVVCSDLSAWGTGAARLRFTTPRIEFFDASGAPVREARIDLPVEEVSEAERDSALAALRRTLAARGVPDPFIQQSLVVQEERWTVKCRFGPLRYDRARGYGAFLEQNPDEFGAGPATLHFLSERGVYLARVAFPTPWRDFDLYDGVAYALTRDPATDVVTLTAYRVTIPDALPDRAARALEAARREGGG